MEERKEKNLTSGLPSSESDQGAKDVVPQETTTTTTTTSKKDEPSLGDVTVAVETSHGDQSDHHSHHLYIDQSCQPINHVFDFFVRSDISLKILHSKFIFKLIAIDKKRNIAVPFIFIILNNLQIHMYNLYIKPLRVRISSQIYVESIVCVSLL